MNTIISEDTQPGGGSGQKSYLQLKVHDGSNVSLESKLTMVIADMIHSCGLPFSLSSNVISKSIESSTECTSEKTFELFYLNFAK